MIRINLLPEQYRRKARTPVKLVLTLTAAALVNTALVGWWAWSAFGVQAVVDSQVATLQMEMDGLAPQVTHHRSLEAESKSYKSREDTLSSITASRISWTKKLDEFIDVVNKGGGGDRHLIWFDDLQVTSVTDPKAKTPGSLRGNGHSGSDKFAQVANFREDLENSPFISDFQAPALPEGTQTLTDETLVPSIVWNFPMSLTIRSLEERKALAAGASAPAGKGGAKTDKNGAEPKGSSAESAPERAPAKSSEEGAR